MTCAMHPAPDAPSRVLEVDALRGFALLGVLLFNMLIFSAPAEQTFGKPLTDLPHPWTYGLILTFVQAKFYGLFALLFGLGFGVQMDRFMTRGERPGRRFRRRMGVLLVFGILHGLLIWMGDILTIYALLGLILPAFARCRPRTLLVWAAGLLLLLVLLSGILAAFSHLGAAQDPQGVVREFAQRESRLTNYVTRSLTVHTSGPYAALFHWRWKALLLNYLQTLVMAPHILAMFLLGFWVHRVGLLQNLDDHRSLLKRIAAIGLGLGIPLNLLFTYLQSPGFTPEGHLRANLSYVLYPVACPTLTLGYAASFMLLAQGAARRMMPWLAAAGRLSLTNYLAQSVVMTTVFEFYGLGLYGKVPMPLALGMGFVLWMIQLAWSRAWLTRFSQGPLEALWRRWAFGRTCA